MIENFITIVRNIFACPTCANVLFFTLAMLELPPRFTRRTPCIDPTLSLHSDTATCHAAFRCDGSVLAETSSRFDLALGIHRTLPRRSSH